MKVVTQHYMGTTEEWKAANPKLYNAVWGFEKTKDGKILAKLGNGEHRWNELKYFDVENIKGLTETLTEIKDSVQFFDDKWMKGDEDTLASAKEYTLQTAEAAAKAYVDRHDENDEAHPDIRSKVEELADNIHALSPDGYDELKETVNRLDSSYNNKADKNMIGQPEGMASLDSEGKIPPEQFNLNILFPIGCSYIQGINDPDPIDRGLPGHWELWTHRAEQYRLTSAALPAFTVYTPGANYTANAYVLWHLPGAGYELFKAKAAITNAAAQLNPILWDKYVLGDIVDRRFLQGWLDDDFAIGHVIGNGDYAGMKVSEVIALGGTFPSWEGGNRPTFNSGIAPDVIRNWSGYLQDIYGGINMAAAGAFRANIMSGAILNGNAGMYSHFYLEPSRVVQTGNENSSRNISNCFWRRVA